MTLTLTSEPKQRHRKKGKGFEEVGGFWYDATVGLVTATSSCPLWAAALALETAAEHGTDQMVLLADEPKGE